MSSAKELAQIIIDAWDDDKIKGTFWHEVVYKKAYPLLRKPLPEDGNENQIANASRYEKLRNWMSSNVNEGWREVKNLGAIAAYQSWDDFDKYLDDLPECNLGLCQKVEVPNER